MAELKTRPNNESVEAFIARIEGEAKRRDATALHEMMAEITGERGRMWGPSIVGFGSYHYVYASGRVGDWFLTGFSPRKNALTVYVMSGFRRYDDLLSRLGKHTTGKACLYVKRLEDVDLQVLRELIQSSVEHLREQS